MKIGIINLFLVNNYGAVAQAYALEKAVSNLGHEAETVRYIQKISKKIYNKQCFDRLGVKDYLLRVFNFELIMKRREKGFERFRCDNLNMSERYNEKTLPQIADKYDKIIVGSDIVWSTARGAFDRNLFLPFFSDANKKVAYAASLGNKIVEPQYEAFLKKYVAGFGDVSLREESSREAVEPVLGRIVPVMPDPVFLITPEDWAAVAVDPKIKGKYIFVYQLRIDAGLVKLVSNLSKQSGCRVIYCPFPMFAPLKCTKKPWISVDEWLGYIKNSEYVVTDSFHAVCFSLIFQKKFFVKVSAFGSRIENVLKTHSLSERMVKDIDKRMLTKEIDFAPIREKLTAERARGLEYLSGILTDKKRYEEAIPCDKLKCVGCSACSKICPHGAITMKQDSHGFSYPELDSERCTRCLVCGKVCPALGDISAPEIKPTAFAAKSTDGEIRAVSSSGGVFTAVSDVVLSGGGVVYGAAFDSTFRVCHFRAENVEERNRFRGSKYVQSDMENVYDSIYDDLSGGREVMFSGTPCQCLAVKKYLSARKCPMDKLIIVDVVCHGAASPGVWQEYLSIIEEKSNSKIDFVNFRSKEKGWHSLIMQVKSGSQSLTEMCNKELSFLKLFHADTALRDSCYNCRLKSFERCGDITLGDFWGIEKTKLNMDDNKGVSLVLVNSQKGGTLLGKINNIELKSCEIKDCIQPSLDRASIAADSGRRFWNEADSSSIRTAINKFAVPSKISVLKDYTLMPILFKTGLLKAASKTISKIRGNK